MRLPVSRFLSTFILTSAESNTKNSNQQHYFHTLMKTSRILLAVVASFFAFALPVKADIIVFDLFGNAGPGLLGGNENPANASGASGGEIGAGITFDTVTLVLAINIGWGSGNGFTDLTGTATVGHLHGATAGTPPAAFSQNASPLPGGAGDLHTRPGWDPSATNGGFQGTLTLTAAQATDLLNGRYYINIHTSANPGGEIRGHLVPEPSSVLLLALGGLGVAGICLRSRKV